MKPLPLLLLALLLLALLPAHAAAAPAPRAIDDAVATAMKTWAVPGVSVVVVRDGKIVHLKGYGVRNVNKDDAVTPDTLFSLGSCGKAFTTAAMAMLVADGKLTWDDRVRDHLPAFRLSDKLVERDVRLRDLVCHRTGLPSADLLWYRAPWSADEGIARLAHLPFSSSFRTTFQYNSVSFRAAGLAAACADGVAWDEMIRKRLLVPLGMKRTCLDSATADKDADRARPHRLEGGEAEPFAPTHVRKPDPIGSVHSSARELAAWLRFHLDAGMAGDKRLVAARHLRETHAPQIVMRQTAYEQKLFPDTTQTSYAMAWVVMDHRGHKVIAHGGALDGQRAQIVLVPKQKLGIAVLSNLHQTPMNVALTFALLESYLDLSDKRDWHRLHQSVSKERAADAERRKRERLAKRQKEKPTLALSAYAGTYEHKAYGRVRVSEAKGALTWEYHGEKLALKHFHFDTFLIDGELPGDTEAVFQLDDKGGVRGFSIAGNLNATFVRAK